MDRLEVEPLEEKNSGLRIWTAVIWVFAVLFLAGFSTYIIQDTQQVAMTVHETHTPAPPPKTITPTPISDQPIQTSTIPAKSATPTVEETKRLPTGTPSPFPYPRRMVIGTSVAGRPLEVYQFGSGPIKKMIIAGIHGGYESNTIVLAGELIQYLKDTPDAIPENTTLYILPSFNPDGAARSHGIKGRANENNVDLNRNFPAHWQPSWPPNGCWNYLPITGGTEPGSEPETQALISFLESHDVEALISYHSAALGIFAGGQPPTDKSLELASKVAAVSDYPFPPIDTGCEYTGQLVDWAAQHDIAALDIELSTHQNTDFNQNREIVTAFLHWRWQNPAQVDETDPDLPGR